MNQLHPIFQQALSPYFTTSRPKITTTETQLLHALQLMKSWVVQYTEPAMSGRGAQYDALKRDLAIVSRVISDATGGNDE